MTKELTIKNLQEWISDLEELAAAKSKAQGRYDQALEALKAQGYESIEDAQAGLEELKVQEKEAIAEASELMEQFKEEFSAYIEV